MPQGFLARFDATRFDRWNMISLLLPRLETWVLCRFFDASMPRFDASTPRFDACSATLVTSIIASIASLVLSSDPPQCSLLRCSHTSFRCFHAPALHARFLDHASTSRFDASMPRFDACFDPGFDNRSKVGVWSRRHSMLVASMVVSIFGSLR